MSTLTAILILLGLTCYLALYLWLEVNSKEKKISELTSALKEAQEQADRYYPATEHLASAESLISELSNELEEANIQLSLLSSIKKVAVAQGARGSELEVCQFAIDKMVIAGASVTKQINSLLKELCYKEAHFEGYDHEIVVVLQELLNRPTGISQWYWAHSPQIDCKLRHIEDMVEFNKAVVAMYREYVENCFAKNYETFCSEYGADSFDNYEARKDSSLAGYDNYEPANQSAYTEMAETMRSAIEEVYGPELTKED